MALTLRGLPRVPPAAEGVQLNACSDPRCENFARLPLEVPKWTRANDGYKVDNKGMRDGAVAPVLMCKPCGSTLRLWSNLACVEEARRLTQLPPGPRCPNADCANHVRPLESTRDAYQAFGTTEAGSPRFRCSLCRRTFSVPATASHRLRRPEKTEEILRLLVNKVPMRRLCEVAQVRPALLYQRIGLLHERLGAHARHLEAAFLRTHHCTRLRIATDRQEHPLAWGSAVDRQSFALQACASADTDSGYILLQHVNFDPNENAMKRELEARRAGDPELPKAYRRFARLWLPHEAGLNDSDAQRSSAPDESALGMAGRGAFVHSTVALAAHFLALRPWLATAEHVHFSLDREMGIERACLLLNATRVRDGSLDAYLVRIDKGLTVSKRRLELARMESWLAERRATQPEATDTQLLYEVLAERYRQAGALEPWRRWVRHPYASMQEPNRDILCLTDDGTRAVDAVIKGLGRASLRAVDRYFMQVRRKLSVLERPIRTSSTLRVWYGYNAYSPRVVMEVLEIFRVVYNFHLAGQDGKTPAQRLGVCDHALSLEALIAGPDVTPRRRAARRP